MTFDSGLYVFLLRLQSASTLTIGALGEHHFPPGWYMYTGRARKNLRRRVERHWSLKPTRRWHFDYLSTALDSEPVGAVVVPDAAGLNECELNRMVGALVGNQVPVAGFGASSVMHSDKLLRLSNNLPLVIEVVDSEPNIEAVLPKIDGMFSGGLITLEKARVISYRSAEC